MAILPIIAFPDNLLRQKSLAVLDVDDSVRRLMDDMLETIYHDGGVGLAAVQVGALKRVIVLDLREDDDMPRASDFYPIYLINPNIVERSKETVIAKEGCLSVPEQGIEVERSKSVKVQFTNYHNQLTELNAEGWLARVIQHEMDHLEGKLLIDYLSPLKRDIAVRKLVKLKKNS